MKRILIRLGGFSLTLAGFLFLAAAASATVLAQASLHKAHDFDLDNKADFVIFRPSTNTWWILRSSDGNFQTQPLGFGLFKRDFFTPGDFNGDNIADYSVWRISDRNWWKNNTFHTALTNKPGDEPVARDYDGDGKTDFAVVQHIPPSPTPVPTPPIPGATPTPVPSPTPPGQLKWYIQRSSDNGVVETQWGHDTDLVAPGDYDGDGKFDLAIYRPGANTRTQSFFWILRSSDNAVQTVAFGLGGDSVVPGDYDGDGTTDFAVVRDGVTSSQNIAWYILRSSAGFTAVSFGLTGSDRPTQADYDGDNKTDIAVWRETDGKFYILRSTAGYTEVKWGTFGDFPVANYDTH